MAGKKQLEWRDQIVPLFDAIDRVRDAIDVASSTKDNVIKALLFAQLRSLVALLDRLEDLRKDREKGRC